MTGGLHAKPPRWESFFKHLRTAALSGDVKSQFDLGLWYFDGNRSERRLYLPRSPQLGFKWVERAALAGDADAMDRLGTCFDAGEGVRRSVRLARLWYRRAVRAGSALATSNLGASYRTTGNHRVAERWFWQAAETGNDDARLSWCRSVLLRRASSSQRTLALSHLKRLARTGEGWVREDANTLRLEANTGLLHILNARRSGWVRVSNIAWVGRKAIVDIDLVLQRESQRWRVTIDRVREFRVTDVNGGGLCVYSPEHPVVRQFSDDELSLRATRATPGAIVQTLSRLHSELFDDWIPFERYVRFDLSELQPRSGSPAVLRARGPRFVLTHYAQALKKNGWKVRTMVERHKRVPNDLAAIHFGSSYIVGQGFVTKRRT